MEITCNWTRDGEACGEELEVDLLRDLTEYVEWSAKFQPDDRTYKQYRVPHLNHAAMYNIAMTHEQATKALAGLRYWESTGLPI